MKNEVLKITNLSFSYGETEILRDLSLALYAGEFLTIIGDNGTGKTTLLNLIMGRLKYFQGELKLFGDDQRKHNHYADLAYISQNAVAEYRNFPTTVEEVIRVHLAYLKKKRSPSEYLAEVGLLEHRKKRLNELSGGQLQRLSLALVLIKEARLIILDEPTSNIDRRFSEELFRRLKDFTREGKSVLLATHDVIEASTYADRILELKDGGLAAVGSACTTCGQQPGQGRIAPATASEQEENLAERSAMAGGKVAEYV